MIYHSRKKRGSYCEDNVIKYFRNTESLKRSVGSDHRDYRTDRNARNDVIVIDTESGDETENNTSIIQLHTHVVV